MNKKDSSARLSRISSEKGVVALAVPLLLIIIIAAAVFLLISQGIIKNPFQQLTQNVLAPAKKQPSVSLQKQYQNPFDKSAQYVNPFAEFKNPFDLFKNDG